MRQLTIRNRLKDISGSKSGWTLFLDRDGVLNRRPGDAYVMHPDKFKWIPGSLEAMGIFPDFFDRIVVVTNQQGIGKGLMTEKELFQVHAHMLDDLKIRGGRIDAVYYASGLRHLDSFNRKPGAGMFMQAKGDFPEIDFRKSVMVGDSFSDVLIGYRLNMVTVFISTAKLFPRQYGYMADYQFYNLIALSDYIKKARTHSST